MLNIQSNLRHEYFEAHILSLVGYYNGFKIEYIFSISILTRMINFTFYNIADIHNKLFRKKYLFVNLLKTSNTLLSPEVQKIKA